MEYDKIIAFLIEIRNDLEKINQQYYYLPNFSKKISEIFKKIASLEREIEEELLKKYCG